MPEIRFSPDRVVISVITRKKDIVILVRLLHLQCEDLI